MEIGEEVSSTSEHGEMLLPGDEPTSGKIDNFVADVGENEDVPLTEGEKLLVSDPSSDGQLNGELASLEPSSPKLTLAQVEVEQPCETTSTSDVVADSVVTSSDPNLAEFAVSQPNTNEIFASMSEEPTSLTTSPTVSTKISPVKRSRTAYTLDLTSLVDKAALTPSITDLKKEVLKPELFKSDSLVEGRVLRLRPTPKVEQPKPPASKLSTKPTDSKKFVVANCAEKMCSKTLKPQKRKLDEADNEENDKVNSVVIQYKGYKKLYPSREPTKKLAISFNPFNLAFRRDCTRSQPPSLCPNFDPTLLQREYAQYLGLQPLVKFRCSNCGMSSFQTMSALNAHKADCTRTCDPVPDVVDSQYQEPKSANIKFTRKVFLCSACGTYYELWNLFLHMREAHRRYICLDCLGMSSSPEKLSDHLKQKHGVVISTLTVSEKMSSVLPQAFYLMCISCDKIYSETDKFANHKCPGKRIESDVDSVTAKTGSSLTQPATSPKSAVDAVHSPTSSCGRANIRKIRELAKKSGKLTVQGKKSEMDWLEEASKSTTVAAETCKTTAVAGETRKATTGAGEASKTQSDAGEVSKTPVNAGEVSEMTVVSGGVVKSPADAVESGKPPADAGKTVVNSLITAEVCVKAAQAEPVQVEEPVKEEQLLGATKMIESCQVSAVEPEPFPLSLPGPETEPPSPEQLPPPIEEITPQILNDILQEPSHEFDTMSYNVAKAVDRVTEELATITSQALPPQPTQSLAFKPPTKRGQRKSGGRRKRPLTMARSRKARRPVVEIHHVNLSGLLPNPLNSIPLLPNQAELDGPSLTSDSSTVSDLPLPPSSAISDSFNESQEFPGKLTLPTNIFKSTHQTCDDLENDSDDSQKLSLVVDESVHNSDADNVHPTFDLVPTGPQSSVDVEDDLVDATNGDIPLAGDDVQPMALALDDKIDQVPIQAVVKECVRTSCLSCNYCRHAHKIAVNGSHLALHLLSEHRYRPTKNETPEDIVAKLKNSLLELESMFFNTETYDNTDPAIHEPHNENTTFDCFQCNFVCSTHKDLFAHKRKTHSKPLLLCVMCKTNFFSYSEMLCHLCPGHYKAEIMFHNVHINFRCCFCKLDTIPSAFRLMVHLRKSHHTCDICLESCSDQQKLSTHLWKHKVNHLCYRCGISYASKPDITKHLFWKHGHESVLCKKCLQKKWPHVYHFCIPPTSFICEECSASFSKAVALKVHKRIHTLEFPYVCGLCEKQFVSRKSLARHEERHRKFDLSQNGVGEGFDDFDDSELKDEIINVTDVVDSKLLPEEGSCFLQTSNSPKEKVHRKHRKERKDKVVDPYDLPPLNLSSDSDSSDGKETPTTLGLLDRDKELADVAQAALADDPVVASPARRDTENLSRADGDMKVERQKSEATDSSPTDKADSATSQDKSSTVDPSGNYPVEGIWENFYKINPTNQNLPYPLCAMKSEVAYSIIMGDHDYCIQPISVLKDNFPSKTEPESGLMDDKMEEINLNVEHVQEAAAVASEEKKKLKLQKKKARTNENSSSSSDSSTDTDSSSCTCGTNCSCSSSSSNSTSSSSSESDSSVGDNKLKLERRQRRKEKRLKQKTAEAATRSDVTTREEVSEEKPVVEVVPWVPVDPPARESELETDESSTDEEFYDKQPGQIANQIIAEKRNQLILSAAPVNNGSPGSPVVDRVSPLSLPARLSESSPRTLKAKEKKRRKISLKEVVDRPVVAVTSLPIERYSPSPPPPPPPAATSQYMPILSNKLSYPLPSNNLLYTPSPHGPANSMAAPDSDKSRSSKRRRIPNKFYGYSSGDDEDKPSGKLRRHELTPTTPLRFQQPPQPSPTPRIQLTVPKQIIRKPTYHKAQKTTKITIVPPPPPPMTVAPPSPKLAIGEPSPPRLLAQPLPERQRQFPPMAPPQSADSTKQDKAVYCYCRCPYDEVSEMIACDDESCPIEWFHFECVGILVPPRGQWYCPGCRKARGLPT